MVEIFKTNVKEINQASRLLATLLKKYPDFRITFDLHDCDKILRVQGAGVQTQPIIQILNAEGFTCEILS